MKLKYVALLCILVIMTSCKLMVCVAKTEKYLPEENKETSKVKVPIDTAALILLCSVTADSLNNPMEEVAGGSAFIVYQANVQPNWKYNGDTILATILKSGEVVAAIPGYPKKISNLPYLYKVYKDNKSKIYLATLVEPHTYEVVDNKFKY